MDEDIQKAIDQVVAQTEQNERKAIIEAYIQDVVTAMRSSVRAQLVMSTMNAPEPVRSELERWQTLNKARFSMSAAEVIGILLRKELLGE